MAFDRVAEDYDRTRALSPRSMAAVVALLTGEVRDRQPCLEVGVGTGRIARPLAAAGIQMTGVDLSVPMLRKLVEQAGDPSRFPVAVADALALPFGDDSFGAGLACHVLHLIAEWPRALAEMVRVVRPEGKILVDLGGWGTGWVRQVQERFCLEAGIQLRHSGANEQEEVDQAMRRCGAQPRIPDPIKETRHGTIAELLERLETGLYSFTWHVQPEVRAVAARSAGRWAEERFGPLDRSRRTERLITWRVYDLPSNT